VFVTGLLGFRGALAYVGTLCLVNLAFVLLFVHDPGARPFAARQASFVRVLAPRLGAFVAEVYASFWRSGTGPIVGTAFALLPCGAMALAYAILPVIQVDYGLDATRIAQLQTLNTIVAALGCLLGGFIADRFGIKRTVAAAYALTALVTFVLASQITLVGLTGVSAVFFVGSIVAHGFLFGVAYGSRNAIFMGMTNPAVAATQFTAFMGMSNLAISLGNYWQGMVAERMGYAQALYLDGSIALLVICLIPFLRAREEPSQRSVPVVAARPAESY
jgi:PAT family beta-lactamase induction signal transducer AmpG